MMRNELIYTWIVRSFLEEVFVFFAVSLLSWGWAGRWGVNETSDVRLVHLRVLKMAFDWTWIRFFAFLEVVAVFSVEVLHTLTGKGIFLLGVRRLNDWIDAERWTITNVRIYMLFFICCIRDRRSSVKLFELPQNAISSILQVLNLLDTVYTC